tara:strand:+ start:187 stop:408 length:222 start_codon:yes stop_codon:yes gene_type:complete
VKFELDIKTILAIGSIIALLGGFYYSTQYRLTSLEEKVEQASAQLDIQSGELSQMQKQLKSKSKKEKTTKVTE